MKRKKNILFKRKSDTKSVGLPEEGLGKDTFSQSEKFGDLLQGRLDKYY